MNLKSICIRALCVIMTVVFIPVGIWGCGRAAPYIEKLASGSAGITMGDYNTFRYSGDSLSSAEDIVKSVFEPVSVTRQSAWDIDMAPQELEIPSESGEIPVPKPSEEVLNAIPYPESMESHDGVIEKYTYGVYSGEQYFDLDAGGQVRNCTDVSNEDLYAESLKDVEFQLDPDSDEPQILIYHTHATESFEPYSRDYYDSSFTSKTTNPEKNIVAVGDKICEQLDKAGIKYIHDTLVHDYPSYNGSYQSSRATVQDILEEYPSIKIALDIHRDGIEREDGTRLAPVAEIDGREAAQIMIISGCDDGTMDMPNYMQNFRFASLLQSTIETMHSGITRPVLFDYRFYNQDLTTGSLLIEVGSHGNSLNQVLYTGELIGESLVEIFNTLS